MLVLGIAYFLLKPARYAILLWGPVIIYERMPEIGKVASAIVPSAFEVAGLAGPILIGLASDKLFGARRMPACVLSLAALTLSLALFVPAMQSGSLYLVVGLLFMMGVTLYGPDSMISGAAAIDFGTSEAAGTATGFVNGCGSVEGDPRRPAAGLLRHPHGVLRVHRHRAARQPAAGAVLEQPARRVPRRTEGACRRAAAGGRQAALKPRRTTARRQARRANPSEQGTAYATCLFDLDDTLIDGDCATLWGRYMTELGWVEKTAFLHQERRLMELYAEGRLAMEDYMDFSLAPIAGRTPAEIAGAVEDFVARIVAPRIHADAVRCLERHRQAGDRLLIISASAHFLVSAIGRRLGVDEVLAIDIEERDGLYTGRTRGTLTYREGKVRRLDAWLAQEGETLAGATFYSDSRNDLPLLSRVDRPHTVNPDPALLGHAREAGWPVLEWR